MTEPDCLTFPLANNVRLAYIPFPNTENIVQSLMLGPVVARFNLDGNNLIPTLDHEINFAEFLRIEVTEGKAMRFQLLRNHIFHNGAHVHFQVTVQQIQLRIP